MSDRVTRIREIVADALGLDVADVGPDAAMNALAAWDSLQHLGVVAALEAELGVELTTDEIPALSSVPAIAAWLEEKGR